MTYRRIACLVLTLILSMMTVSWSGGIALAAKDDPEEIWVSSVDDGAKNEIIAEAVDASGAVLGEPVDDAVPVTGDLFIGGDSVDKRAEHDVGEIVIDDEDTDTADGDIAAEAVVELDLAPEDEADESDEDVADDGEIIAAGIESNDGSKLMGAAVASNSAIKHSISITQSGKTVAVSGSISDPYRLAGVFVDLQSVSSINVYNASTVNASIDISGLSIGYHTVWLSVINSSNPDTVIGDIHQRVEINITDRPTYTGKIEVYHNYFNYYPYDMAMHNQKYNLYMEYSSDNGKTWKRSGYMRANMIKLFTQQGYKIGGLAANTTYKTRIRYGTTVTYSKDILGDGQSHFFGGPVLNTYTIRTGAAGAPNIKSVSIKATKIRHHKVRHPGYYNVVGGSVFWHKAYTEKYYTCNLKVTVKLKKKPGTNGMWISVAGQSKYVAGNKKKYSATFTPYPNYFAKKPKGRYKYTVTVRSGQNKDYGGYSPAWSKTKRLKK